MILKQIRLISKLIRRQKVYTVEELKNNNWKLPEYEVNQKEFFQKSQKQRYFEYQKYVGYRDVMYFKKGGTLGLGHPQVYIRVDKKIKGEKATCKYCGLKFVRSDHH